MSVAVWVGILALASIDAETGVFMLLYLELAFEEAKSRGRLRDWGQLRSAVTYGAAQAAAAQIHDLRNHLHRAVSSDVVRGHGL